MGLGVALWAPVFLSLLGISQALSPVVAHHHGAGVFRNRWLRRELGTGMDVLQAIKDALDPDNRLNPGKLGLRPAPGAVEVGHG